MENELSRKEIEDFIKEHLSVSVIIDDDYSPTHVTVELKWDGIPFSKDHDKLGY